LATILVKNVPEDLLKRLKRLKVDLGCRTWAELLGKLVESERITVLGDKELKEMRTGVRGFLKLRRAVSRKWAGHPSVLEETRSSRHHRTP
jgi:hypothetical protein